MQAHLLAAVAASLCAALFASQEAQAHGTLSKPISRIYACRQANPENPTNAACAAAKAIGGAQPFYDWAGINQAEADGNHRQVVPDGELCSGGNAKYRGMNLNRTDWSTSPIRADARGRYTFEYLASAPHKTRDWVFYVTREGWQPGSPLRWDDLEQFCSLGHVDEDANGIYRLDCPLPKRTGQHIIYNTWQRSDSKEAFYTCADVRFEGGDIIPPPEWEDAGAITARGDLETGTTLALRVFNANGNDLESPKITLATGQTSATQWPLALGHQVNASAQHARVGVLKNGIITPIASATENRVYLKPGHRFQLDTQLPDPVDPPPGDHDFVYPDGIGSYTPGETVVKGADGKLYACRPFPEGAWCNVNAEPYRPGTGSAWRDAWIAY
ncbi:lytic polysaccharide monooxygenase [Stenotrophomonas maltophilia]|jgi:chitin-binding protein|uniref:lytic polysaccharide monooxygenase n=1 Tax=Stenotrophomonas TaxID=40323 RepID=UPI0006AC157A|nr:MULTISPECIES: lytic polysaccharide monooxygenase [Stenotrophomonas]KOQ67434.1 cellulose-binding protein [Stenotrophomonas maltophilia]MBN7830766.1 lytic polysaccharide monooxygenase [Stenotrophomonas maltophilia]MBN7833674.1 lytic polysaccharide monooxygenase [Stenotrophomonas maltophilia]MBN7857537.1 lytic polysaccharide monooxygenase [Stenotrophomonas maltophilia]MBN7918107.1 lytic polysaccharide monooxygenase [Stenotrophomonas maltophilia]